MKLNRATLQINKPTKFSEDVDFSKKEFDPLFLRGITKCHVDMEATQYDEFLRVDFDIDASIIAVCAYTLDDVKLPLKIHEEIAFSDNPEDDSSFYEENVIIDLDEYILGIILAYIPAKVVKKGAKPPKDGEGYRVLTEDQLAKERSEKKDDRWSKLDDLDL